MFACYKLLLVENTMTIFELELINILKIGKGLEIKNVRNV